jgi:leader peptidase (prepilin peptidase)/N-methyltransferase
MTAGLDTLSAPALFVLAATMMTLVAAAAMAGSNAYGVKLSPAWAFAGGGLIVAPALTLAPNLGTACIGVGLGASLLTLAAIDARLRRLPDPITLPLALAGLLVALASAAPAWSHLLGAAAGYGLITGLAFAYRQLRGRDGIGLGDAKLLAAAGAWLGWRSLPMVILGACLVSLGALLTMALRGRRLTGQDALPFGPPLALSFWIVWLWR